MNTKTFENRTGARFSLLCIAAALITYMSMYAFRKPLSVATFEGLTYWGMDYKIIAIISQVIGYTCSKFLGIKIVSSMKPGQRTRYILGLVGVAWMALFFFAWAPQPYNVIFLIINGLPLGMIFGIVISFLEGHKNTELLGAGLCISFITASGIVRSVGQFLIVHLGVSDFWMPFLTGLVFVPFLLLGVWLLGKIPPPSEEDKVLRSERAPMTGRERRKFGVTWYGHHPHYYLATGIYTHNDINKLGKNPKNAFVSTSRGVGRFQPWGQHSLFQVGGAFSFRTREKNTAEPPVGSLSSDGITTLFDIPMLEASVPNMGTEVKGLVELLCLGTRFMVQAEYYWDRMNRTMGNAYRTHGGYVLGGFLLTGNHFEYDSKTAVPGRPLSPRALLLTARLDYADANDSQAGIYGGSVRDVSLGLSYYLNKYIGFKLNASYVWVDEHCNDFYQGNFFLAQMRVQYIF